jgi:hypothetical protein
MSAAQRARAARPKLDAMRAIVAPLPDGLARLALFRRGLRPRSVIDKQRRGENRNMFPAPEKSLPARLNKLPVRMLRELER